MSRRLTAAALPAAAVVLAMSTAGPAAAQPTTPIPQPANPSAPPASAPIGPQPLGHAIGDAGTGLAVVRLLPNSTPTKTIIPGAEDKLPKQAAAEMGFGLASAQANSEAYLSYEKAIAQSAPGGFAFQGSTQQAPGSISQTAPPSSGQPRSAGFNPPSSPLDTLVKAGLLNGLVRANWSDTLGPCVDTIADASTELTSLSALNAIPTLPGGTDLTGVFDAPNLDAKADQAIIDGLKGLAGPLSTLGGTLAGQGSATTDGKGSLLSLPNTISARSAVKLVDIPGSKNKAVQSTSTLQVAAVKLLAGTPYEVSINVVSQPTLQVTSTGDKATSTVKYTAPVLEVVQGGKSLGKLDAANPTMDLPIGIPLPGAGSIPGIDKLPIIGGLLGNGAGAQDALSKGLQKLDLGVIRLSVASLSQKGEDSTQPFKGYQVGATARMLDLQVLPTDALGLPNLPSALAQVSLGEQVARAFAPTGGVVCGTATSAPQQPPAPMPQGKSTPPLAYTNAAYQSVPMFWAGTAMLLVGVVLVAALPRRRSPQVRITPDRPTD